MMAQRIREDGLDDAQMGPMMRMATDGGVPVARVMDMLCSLGVPREQAVRVACGQGLLTDDEAERVLGEAAGVSPDADPSADVLSAKRHKRMLFWRRGAVIAFWVVVWQLLDTAMDNRLVLAGPIRVLQALVVQVAKSGFWLVCGASLVRIASGFLLSFSVGILLALAAHRFRLVYDFVEPLMSLLRTIPVVSIIIMLLIWVGSQLLTVYLSFVIVLPLIYTNMLAGLDNVDPQMLEMARMYGLSRWRRFLYVYRPAFMPFLSSACRLALGMSWKSGIMAEVLATPKPSVGKEMSLARTYLNTPDLFAWTVVVMLMSWAFERLFMWLLRRAGRLLGECLGMRDDEGGDQ